MPRRVLLLFVLLIAAAHPVMAADPLATARRLYNLGQYDRALEAAREAESNPATAASARLVIGRARLERYRTSSDSAELEGARTALRSLDPRALDPRERVEWMVGLAELLFLDDRFGAAAELLNPILESSGALGPDAHERVLEWWASSLDRQAQGQDAAERSAIYARVVSHMEQELLRDPGSTPASYWLAAAARGAGDLDRAWAAASAGWVRAPLARDRGAALRADLDRLVTQAIIPERAAKLPGRDHRQAIAGMASEWEAFKASWIVKVSPPSSSLPPRRQP